MNKFFEPVRNRLILAICGLCLCIGLISSTISICIAEKNRQETTQTLHQNLAHEIVHSYLLMNDHEPNRTAAQALFSELMILGPNFEFYLLDAEGHILTHSLDPTTVKRTQVAVEPINEFITHKGSSMPIFGDNPLSDTDNAIFSAASIDMNGNRYGILYIILGSAMHTDIMQALAPNAIQQQLGVILLLSSLFLVGLLVILSKLVTQPLTRLSLAIQRNGFQDHIKNQTAQPWDNTSNNEFHQLGTALFDAHKTLHRQYFQLKKNDTMRKELLAHLSHDLRTPMASLLGYLETYLLQEDTLSAEDRHEYVSTAKKSAVKANRLLEQLFELAHLDHHEVSMAKESFPIAELIQDILANFKVKAAQKNITMELKPKDSSLIVTADIEKIDRVFNNLIENAIRHTPDNGSIQVTLNAKSEHLIICVQDSGVGIEEQDLPHVFDAHFKGANSVRENTAHGGLGLAITKRLLELHNSQIHVSSTLGQGAAFYFRLPLSLL